MTYSLSNRCVVANVCGSQDYLVRAGLSAASQELQQLSHRLVTQLEERVGVYRPKRGGGRVVESRGWRQRLLNYEWPLGIGFVDACAAVDRLSNDLGRISVKIDKRQVLDEQERNELQNLARRIFEWGGVTRGASKQNPSVATIESVIRSGMDWRRVDYAPLDAGWTKVAAFATRHLEGSDRIPQVIYDSRVSNALIRNVEALILDHADNTTDGLEIIVRQHLRTLPGRGGNRGQPYRLSWKSGYGRWEAQYFASLVVGFMCDALNSSPERYGLMPDVAAIDGPWTPRGVEMVLFMEGY